MLKHMRLLAASTSLGLVSYQVYASNEKEKPKKESLSVDELSLYSSPVNEAKYVEDKPTELEANISQLRKSVEPYYSWCQDAYCSLMPKFDTAVGHTKGASDLLKTAPPGFLPRLGVISLAGVVGLFLARGSRIKKMIYPLSFAGIAASIYYPQQAITFAKTSGSVIYDWGLQGYVAAESLWKDSFKEKKKAKNPSDTDNSPVTPVTKEAKPDKQTFFSQEPESGENSQGDVLIFYQSEETAPLTKHTPETKKSPEGTCPVRSKS